MVERAMYGLKQSEYKHKGLLLLRYMRYSIGDIHDTAGGHRHCDLIVSVKNDTYHCIVTSDNPDRPTKR